MTKQPKTVWVATVDTHYEIAAVGETEQKARNAALKQAVKYCKIVGCKEVTTKSQAEAWFAVHSYEVPMNGAAQEY